LKSFEKIKDEILKEYYKWFELILYEDSLWTKATQD
jgi:hypothetical protein